MKMFLWRSILLSNVWTWKLEKEIVVSLVYLYSIFPLFLLLAYINKNTDTWEKYIEMYILFKKSLIKGWIVFFCFNNVFVKSFIPLSFSATPKASSMHCQLEVIFFLVFLWYMFLHKNLTNIILYIILSFPKRNALPNLIITRG